MKPFILCSLILATFCIVQSISAQPPGERGGREQGPGGGPPGSGPPERSAQRGNVDPAAAVERIMQLDTDGDHVLTVAEVNDDRLTNLLTRADKDSDGRVTPTELTALF